MFNSQQFHRNNEQSQTEEDLQGVKILVIDDIAFPNRMRCIIAPPQGLGVGGGVLCTSLSR